MLESVREYARELLAASGELEATAQAHLQTYIDLAARARQEIRGPRRNAGWTASGWSTTTCGRR
jgi:hypothetical protein